jgi:hypothetical protein
MSLKANKLKDNEMQKKAIAKETKTILGYLDDQLKIAHENGKHEVIIDLPISFSIPNMKNADAQRKIYYYVLCSLLDRGFENVKIRLKRDTTLFHIKFMSDEELNEMREQNALLAKYMIKEDEHLE